jgi:CO/xanthine dehydrogenase FAD-binding subunit
MVRNTATVAGNIACGSPAADLVPPLMSLDAELTLASKSGTRTVALDDYYLGYKQDVRRPDELITRISWSRLPENSVNSFYKLARRLGDAITVTGVAVTLVVANGTCAKARIALGAVSPVVLRAKKAEALLEGQALTPALIDAAAVQAVAECSPIDDVRASAEYRRHIVEALTRRLVSQAWHQLS